MTRTSPKGLIQNRSATPEEMAELGICWEQIDAGVFQLRGPDIPDIRHKIKNLIAFWREFAESLIEANPAIDGTLDRTAAAKALLAKLQVIEHSLAADDLFHAIYYTLLSWTYVHQLTIIDNETPIVAWQESIEGARSGGKLRSAKIKTRNHKMAQEFLTCRGGNLRDTALMAEIGAKRKLKRRASVNAIKSGLRNLSRG
jgi:hypothetical protein